MQRVVDVKAGLRTIDEVKEQMGTPIFEELKSVRGTPISTERATAILASQGVEFVPDPERPEEEGQGYSVNALSKLLGRDRRTIDKALVGIPPTRIEGKTKFYLLEEVEQAIRERNVKLKDDKLTEEIRKLRMANDEKDKKLILKSKVKESLRRCLTPAAAILEQRLVNEYPTGVAGLDVPQARIYGKRLCDELMVFLQSLETEWA
jgi:signal recognition particle GTPase